MRQETDLNAIKAIAKGLLNISILETEYSPIIVSHPFTKCGIVTMLDGNDFSQLDITKNKDNFDKWKRQVEKQIDESQDVFQVYYLLNDSYRMLFFDDVSKHLSQEDYSTLLGSVWVGSEYANVDANVSKEKMLAHFKNADKSVLMSETELETYNDLEDTVVVYRGVTSKNKKNTNALSWTISFGKAKWFAERWGGTGIVYCATIDKKNILAYFDRKEEDEVVVDFHQLQNVKVVNKPVLLAEKNIQICQMKE